MCPCCFDTWVSHTPNTWEANILHQMSPILAPLINLCPNGVLPQQKMDSAILAVHIKGPIFHNLKDCKDIKNLCAFAGITPAKNNTQHSTT